MPEDSYERSSCCKLSMTWSLTAAGPAQKLATRLLFPTTRLPASLLPSNGLPFPDVFLSSSFSFLNLGQSGSLVALGMDLEGIFSKVVIVT